MFNNERLIVFMVLLCFVVGVIEIGTWLTGKFINQDTASGIRKKEFVDLFIIFSIIGLVWWGYVSA